MTDNPLIRIRVNKIESRITFKTKTEYLKPLTLETMDLLGNKKMITKDENGENVLHFENTEVKISHSNIANNNYSIVLTTFDPKKSFDQLLNISPKNAIF